MTTRLIVLIFSLLAVHSGALGASTDRERDGFVGPVHQVVVEKGGSSPTASDRHQDEADFMPSLPSQDEAAPSPQDEAAAPSATAAPPPQPAPEQRVLWQILTYDTHRARR